MIDFIIPSDAHTFMVILLGLFTMASCILAVSTLTNAWRLRNVFLTWREGRLAGYPLFATLFLGISVLLTMLAITHNFTGYYTIAGAYVLMSLNWFVSSYYMSKRYITDNGIVKNINDPSQTVTWDRMYDFVDRENENGFTFVFMYRRMHSNKDLPEINRIELSVPKSKLHSFKKVLDHKLGRRLQKVSDVDAIRQTYGNDN